MTTAKPKTDEYSVDNQIESVVSLSRQMLSDVLRSADHISDVNRVTHVLSMNARVEAARAGAVGMGFGVVAQELTHLSAQMGIAAKDIVTKSRSTGTQLTHVIERLSTQVRDNRLCDLALTNIDVIDRNLYERSCDVRWWATDSAVCNCLHAPADDTRRHASRRLGQILDSYTVYFDLAVATLDGKVIVNGRPGKYRATNQDVSNCPWFRSALEKTNGTQFGMESVHKSTLVNNQLALVYSCVVREAGQVNGEPLGVLGIVFAWEALGQTVVQRTPLSPQEWARTRACIVDDNGEVLADSAGQPLGERIHFEGMSELFQQPRGAISTRLGAQNVRIAHAASPGYETYHTGWHSLLIRQVGES